MQNTTLWYKQPAKNINGALPIGNGKLAAMVYGGIAEEKIWLDDSTFWSGEPSENNNREDTPALVKTLRGLLLEENYAEADRLGKDFVGVKNNYGTHMPMGNLLLTHNNLATAESFTRALDIIDGVCSADITAGGATWHRECFISHPAKVFALRYGANNNAPFTVTIAFEGIDNNVHTDGLEGSDLLLAGDAYEDLHSDGHTGVSMVGRIRILTDGSLREEQGKAIVEDATEIILLAVTETTMYNANPMQTCTTLLDAAETQGYTALREAHIADNRALMKRVDFQLAGGNTGLPTNERIAAYAKNRGGDAGLMALVFQYGRYLTLAGSRADSPLPTHMGGIWNDNIYNKQDSTQDYHIDVNVQMQYWAAYPGALSECANPLDNWLRDTVVPSGHKTARQEYDANGWVAHVTSNPWGYTSLGWAYNWGSFTFGGLWCATLLWDRYEYTGDTAYLQSVWPVLRGCAEFALDYLFFDEASGYYMTGPSYSPENHFFGPDGGQYTLSLSTTCDVVLVREMLQTVLRAANVLGLKDDILPGVRDHLAKLPPYKIGKLGGIQEWFHDFDEPIPNHRHSSHLLGFYPFAQITPEGTPELSEAVRNSMSRRYKDFEVTSWGYALYISMYARLYDADAAMEVLADDVDQLAADNLTFLMPEYVPMWGGTWELDGNTGLTAAFCELLAQSRAVETDHRTEYEIRLLPALPKEWADGSITGLCLRGGYRLDMAWQNGTLTSATLHSAAGLPCQVLQGEQRLLLSLAAGESAALAL